MIFPANIYTINDYINNKSHKCYNKRIVCDICYSIITNLIEGQYSEGAKP